MTLNALFRKAHPAIIWNDRDMLWIAEQDKEHIKFIVNRAYHVTSSSGGEEFDLLENAGGYSWPDEGGGSYRFTRSVDDAPKVLAEDRAHGALYQIRWKSAPQAGTGHYVTTRNIYVMRDANRQWRVIAEGPAATSGRGGSDIYMAEDIDTHVEWTMDSGNPIRLLFTDVKTLSTRMVSRNEDPTDSLTLCVALAPSRGSQDELDTIINGKPAASPFKDAGRYFMVVPGPESMKALAMHVARWHLKYRSEQDLKAKGAIAQEVEESLKRANASLGVDVRAGERVIVPDDLIRAMRLPSDVRSHGVN